MLKNIRFEIEEIPTSIKINEQGEYVFGIFTSNSCDDEFENSIRLMAELWEAKYLEQEVSMMINVRLRCLFEVLYDLYNSMEKINAEDMHLFDALKTDCQWIVDQINKLEVIK